MDPKPAPSIDDVTARENLYHLREMRDRVAGGLFTAIYIQNRGEISPRECCAEAIEQANEFVLMLAAKPFNLEGKA